MEILLKLIFAHIISDFFLQTDKLCKCKNKKSPNNILALLIHGSVVTSISYLLLGDWKNWIIPLVIFITHFAIDFLKTLFENRFKYKLYPFVIDQILHVGVIVILSMLFSNFVHDYEYTKIGIILIAYLLILKPSSILLSLLIKLFNCENSSNGLKGAGNWIGYFERLLILTFILTENFECIGFLLAAKSIFRFGELKDKSEIQFTEYVLLGTLASFTIAVIIGFGTLEFMKIF